MMTPTLAPEPKQPVYHADFINSGRYLRGWSERKVRTYTTGLAALGNTPRTKAGLAAWVVAQRDRGLTRGGINMYARTINSYLSWLHEEGHVSERLRIKLLPDPPKPLTPISDSEIRKLVLFRPQHSAQKRTWTLVLLMMDCGLRISEALGLDRANIDLHNCVVRVLGKGNRERLVPISLECRKRLYLLLKSTTHDAVFATRSGLRLSFRNAYRDIKAVCKLAGVVGAHIHPHAFRHCFAVTYVRRGGDIYRLSRLLGHASITTTQRYLRSMGVDTINEGHQRLSPLSPVGGAR
jgi:integrase/recombinase XerD